MDGARWVGLVSARVAGRDASDATALRSIGPALRSLRDHEIILRLLLDADDATVNCSWPMNLGSRTKKPHT